MEYLLANQETFDKFLAGIKAEFLGNSSLIHIGTPLFISKFAPNNIIYFFKRDGTVQIIKLDEGENDEITEPS